MLCVCVCLACTWDATFFQFNCWIILFECPILQAVGYKINIYAELLHIICGDTIYTYFYYEYVACTQHTILVWQQFIAGDADWNKFVILLKNKFGRQKKNIFIIHICVSHLSSHRIATRQYFFSSKESTEFDSILIGMRLVFSLLQTSKDDQIFVELFVKYSISL